MSFNSSFSNSQDTEKMVINHQEIDQIIVAILAGKYSWACVLLLRFIGYNPIHYLPYTTYIRLVRENANQSNKKVLKKTPTKIVS